MSITRSKNRPRNSEASNGNVSGEEMEPETNGHSGKPVLITGGAGFIGTNLAHRFLSAKQPVIIYDDLSRPGVDQNLAWLRRTHGDLLEFRKEDVRDPAALRDAVKRASRVFHFAAQVAVTTSLDDPIEDFEINARGTLNLLEAIRQQASPPSLVFTSTNKVYGDLRDVKLRTNRGRYEPVDDAARQHGFSESRPLHFHSPYGCSKGAACQYVQDYSRTFGLRTVVFRMSCIYGPHQFGTEDQGWVAHFLIKALQQSQITLYGDGRQVRDILFVEDLVEAFLKASKHIDALSGEAFNIGGGPSNTISLLELIDLIGELHGTRPVVRFDEWRPADQQYYVSDTRKFSQATGWQPQVNVRAGVGKLYRWLQEFHQGIAAPAPAVFPVHRGNGHLALRTKSVTLGRNVRLKRSRNGNGSRQHRADRKLVQVA